MSGRSEIADTDVAVIGMAGRFPGARNVAEFWENARNGIESIRWSPCRVESTQESKRLNDVSGERRRVHARPPWLVHDACPARTC